MTYENFSSRLESELKHELQITCAVKKVTIQEALNEAIKEWIASQEKEGK